MAFLTFKTHFPSPSTICYTVSNTPPRRSPFSKLFHLLSIVLRVIVAVSCLAIALLQSHPWWGRQTIEWAAETALRICVTNMAGARFGSHGDRWWVITVVASGIVWALSRRGYIEESLLVIRGLGIQTSTSSPSWLFPPTTRFIPTTQLQDIFIHEAFIGFSVKFYLAVIVEGEEQAVVVFPALLPRRELLEEVWRGSRAVLGWAKG